MTWLEIGAARTTLRRPGEPPASHALDIGARSIAALFTREPPAAHEIERAIDVVEDALMTVPPALQGGDLATRDAHVRAWARADESALALARVEAMFQRLASAALGDPSALRDAPRSREAAAALLIVREAMHHLGAATIALRAGA